MAFENFQAIQHYSKEELTYRALRSAILSNTLKPGEKLMLRSLADRFHVSTMPIRQALMRLEAEHLVTRGANGSLIVAPLSPQEVTNVFSLRSELEGLAARWAVPNLSPADLEALEGMVGEIRALVSAGRLEALVESNARFHFKIHEATGNEHLVDMLRRLWDHTHRYHAMFFGTPGVAGDTLQEHEGILEALKRRDVARAESLMRAHMENSARVMRQLVEG